MSLVLLRAGVSPDEHQRSLLTSVFLTSCDKFHLSQELLEVSLTLELVKEVEVTVYTGSDPGSITANEVPQSSGRNAKKGLHPTNKWKPLIAKGELEDATPVLSLEDH